MNYFFVDLYLIVFLKTNDFLRNCPIHANCMELILLCIIISLLLVYIFDFIDN